MSRSFPILCSVMVAAALFLGAAGTSKADTPVAWSQRQALQSLYKAMDGDNWKPECRAGFKTPPLESDGFSKEGTENTWGGPDRIRWIDTTVNSVKGLYMTHVDFRDCGLKGTFLDSIGGAIPFLGGIPRVQYLNLSGNEIRGPIPAELSYANLLITLVLGSNKFTGLVPAVLFEHPSLRGFVLDGNGYTGFETPQSVSTKLEYFNIRNNPFDGPIPEFFGDLVAFQNLDLSNHGFTGQIPASLFRLPRLGSLSLKQNRLTGPIPLEILTMPRNYKVDLSWNKLTGPLPVPNLDDLPDQVTRTIVLSRNRIDGSLPPEWLSLPSVWELDLSDNLLSGPLPVPARPNSPLAVLDLERNLLDGPLPESWDRLGNLRILKLGDNLLEGTIPAGLCVLSDKLAGLYLYRNRLTGLSQAPGCLENATHVYISRNAIAQEMPADLALLLAGTTGYTGAGATWTVSDWNGLFPGPAQRDAYEAKMPRWREWQTLPPGDPAVEALGSRAVRVSWTPVEWPAIPGRYRVSLTSKGGGGVTSERINVDTANLSNAVWLVSGLTPERTYEVRVRTVTDPHAGNANTVVSVGGPTLEVTMPQASDEAGMAANPDRMTFVAYPSRPMAPAQEVAILGTSGGEPRWRVTPSENWLTVAPTFGRGDAILTVTVSDVGKPGNHQGVIGVGPDLGLPGDSFDIPVTLVVLAEDPAALTVQPTSLAFHGTAGGRPAAAQNAAVVVGEEGLAWEASMDEDWLRVRPADGIGHGMVFVDVDPAGRTAGTYNGTIVFHRAGDPSQELARLQAVMTLAAPLPTLDPETLAVEAGTEDETPASAKLALSFPNDEDIPWRIETFGAFLSDVSPLVGRGTSEIDVRIAAFDMAPGQHNGELWLFAPPEETDPTAVVAVVLTVQEGIVVIPDTGGDAAPNEDTGTSTSEDMGDPGPGQDAWQGGNDLGPNVPDGTALTDAYQGDGVSPGSDVPGTGGKGGGCATVKATNGPGPAILFLLMLCSLLLMHCNRREERR